MGDETLILNSVQSLALRRMVEALRTDDRIYSACPDPVRSALCDFLMPPYSSAETHILALQQESESRMQLVEKFGRRIAELETELGRRKAPTVEPCPVPAR